MGQSSFDNLPPECPACDGLTNFLGRLGRRDHWYCPSCAMQTSTPSEPDPVPADESGDDDEGD